MTPSVKDSLRQRFEPPPLGRSPAAAPPPPIPPPPRWEAGREISKASQISRKKGPGKVREATEEEEEGLEAAPPRSEGKEPRDTMSHRLWFRAIARAALARSEVVGGGKREGFRWRPSLSIFAEQMGKVLS